MNSEKPNNILKILILAKARNYPLCTSTGHFGDNFCFTNLSGGTAKLILKCRGMNTPSFQAPLSIHGKLPITVNCCLMCGKTNSRLSSPENMTNPVRKPFHFWRTWAIVVTEPPNEYILPERYSWIPVLWPVKNDFANALSNKSFYLHAAEFPLSEKTSLRLSWDTFPVCNHVNLNIPKGNVVTRNTKMYVLFHTDCDNVIPEGRWTRFIEELMQSTVHLEVNRLRCSMDQSWKLLMSLLQSKWNRKLLNSSKSWLMVYLKLQHTLLHRF